MAVAMAPRRLWCCWILNLLYCIELCVGFGSPMARPHLLGSAAAAARRSMPLSKVPPYETFYFTQLLDHFTFSHPQATFQQKYLVNKEFWHGAQKAGPIFLYCGNEAEIEYFADISGFLLEIARRFGALLIFAEHRYCGESMPFGNERRAYKNAKSLSYLTTEQALADFATLITDFKKNLSAKASPVTAFGGSYGGMLAAWFRLKYPHIVIGTLAASAPILQFEDLVPDDIFNKIISSDFKVCKAMTSVQLDNFDILSRIYAGFNIINNSTGEVECFDLTVGADEISGWGRQDIKAVLKDFGSNIVFSNGLQDPWSGGSVLEDISSSIIAIVTKEGAHHIDLRASTKEDPSWLVDQRESEINQIRHWLAQFYETLIVI
ncbi:hypothetical protein O6H91_01G171700 [Diphasiastrum complanatum]|uniref:Uncharacterized protein n=1 Tax=Diphasiastrum complanatum TaxID=34168 RepID=A0ACC2EZ07_DIPCM|nr:hypothetical protein O6H91_01G171700 [Diphasiastrum complanatum]